MTKRNFSRLTRELHPTPSFVKEALTEGGLMDAYEGRPAYQQNDYIGWITHAKLEATQQKRLNIMLNELKRGDGYMGLPYTTKETIHHA